MVRGELGAVNKKMEYHLLERECEHPIFSVRGVTYFYCFAIFDLVSVFRSAELELPDS